MLKSKTGPLGKSLSVVLTLLLIIGSMPLFYVPAAAVAATEGLEYAEVTFTKIVEGEEDEEDLIITNSLYSVVGYNGDDRIITVPASANGRAVEYVADYAFASRDIAAVYLPDTIRGLGKGAFMGCDSLKTVVIGKNADVSYFGYFSGLEAVLSELDFVINEGCFASCVALRHFAVYTDRTIISLSHFAAENAFAGCKKLTFYACGGANMVKSLYTSRFASDATMKYVDLDTVESNVTGIALAPESVFMAVGENAPITVSVLPSNASFLYNIFSFSSSDDTVACVGDEGVITAVGNGNATITVTSINGYTKTCDITVAERNEGDYNYRFLDDGTVEIAKFDSGVTGAVTIPEKIAGKTVSSIGNFAFKGCSGITSVVIPDNILTIGSGAFYGCTGLVIADFENASSLNDIGNSAFYGCSSLAYINLKNAPLAVIGDAAFRDCSSLVAVILPDTLTVIGKDCFLGDGSLSIFTVYGYALTLLADNDYFENSAPLTVYAPAGSNVNTYASGKGFIVAGAIPVVTDLTWKNAKTALFVGESGDVSVDAQVNGSAETEYAGVAFSTDNSKTIFVDGNTVTGASAGSATLYAIAPDGTPLEQPITVTNAVSGDYQFKLIENMTKAEITGYTNTTATETVVPDTVSYNGADIDVVSIGFGAFANSPVLEKVTLGKNIVSLNGSAFDCAYALEEIAVDADNAYYTSVDGVLYNKLKSGLIKYPAAKTGDTFAVPSGVAKIGDYAFKDNKNLTYITLPNSLTSVGVRSFSETEKLMGLILPGAVAEIGDFAFAYSPAISYVLIPKATSVIGESVLETTGAYIYGYPGYYAQTYALANDIKFRSASLLVEVSELRLSANLVSVNLGSYYDLYTDVYPASASFPDYTLEVSDSSIASIELKVDEEGNPFCRINAIKEGTVEVIAKAACGVTAVCTVNVVGDAPISSDIVSGIRMQLSPDKLEYENGEELDFSGSVFYATFEDGSEKKIIFDGTMLAGVRIRGYNPLIAGSQTVEIIYGEAMTTLSVTVKERTLVGINIVSVPYKTTYVEGTPIELAGLVVMGIYNNGQVEEITDIESSNVPNVPGNYDVVVGFDSFTDSFPITVVAKSLVSIAITAPTKTEYAEGTTLDTTGFAAVGTYNNGTTAAIPVTDFTFEGFDSSVLGAQRVDAVYTLDGGLEIKNSFYITILGVSSIYVAITPDKTVYENGDALDLKGAVVYAAYKDGTTKKIVDADGTMDPAVRIRAYDPLKAGSQTVEVIYGDLTTTITVTVNERYITAIEITNLPTITTFVEGSTIDTAGLVVTATYNNGQKDVITEYEVSNAPNTIGTHDVTVTANNCTATFEITVIAKTLISIEITAPTTVAYTEGEFLDLAGFAAVGTYDNGTTVNLSEDYFVFDGYDPYTIGKQKVDAIYICPDDSLIVNSFYVTVAARTLTGMEIVEYPDKEVYILGEKLDITGLVVVATYDNNTFEYLRPAYDYEFDNAELGLGENYFTIEYEGFTATFKVLVVLGEVKDEFSYKYLEDGSIEIVKANSKIAGPYTIPADVDGIPVTSISKFAFSGCKKITSVVIPDSVTEIGNNAFEGCDILKSVTLSNNIDSIPDKMFYSCDMLASITVPNSVGTIGSLAFAQCDSLGAAIVPESVFFIEKDAFDYSDAVSIVAQNGTYASEYARKQGLETFTSPLSSGDINGDGVLTADDARFVLRVTVGLEKLDTWKTMYVDMNGDGIVTADDARIILRKSVGLE